MDKGFLLAHNFKKDIVHDVRYNGRDDRDLKVITKADRKPSPLSAGL